MCEHEISGPQNQLDRDAPCGSICFWELFVKVIFALDNGCIQVDPFLGSLSTLSTTPVVVIPLNISKTKVVSLNSLHSIILTIPPIYISILILELNKW